MNAFIQLTGLFKREVSRYFKVPLQTIGTPIVNTALYLMIFGVSLGSSIHMRGDLPYLAFLIPGLIAMSVIKNSFDNSTSAIIGPKYVNELQDLRVVPLSIYQIAWAKSLASISRGLLVGVITYLVGQVFFYGLEGKIISIANPLALIYFLFVGGIGFGFLGIAVGMWSKSFEHINAVSSLILLPLIYLGGVFFSLENLLPIWKQISFFNPLFYIINGVRYAILGATDVSFIVSAIVTMTFVCMAYLSAHLSLKKGSRFLR